MMTKMLKANELADYLRVTEATVRAWQRSGKIPCLRASRRLLLFDLNDVLAALDGDAVATRCESAGSSRRHIQRGHQ